MPISRRSSVAARRAALAAAVAAMYCVPAGAAPFTWDGGSATTNNWTDAINWSTNVAPTNDGKADLTFAGAVRTSPNIDVAFNIGSLAFANGAAQFIIGGAGTLTIRNGVANNDDSTHGLLVPIVLALAQTWTSGSVSATGSLSFGGATLDNGGNLLTLDTLQASLIVLSNTVSGAGGVTKNGPGSAGLAGAGANTYGGTTTVNGGLLILQKSGGFDAAVAGPLVIGDGVGVDTVRLAFDNQIGGAVTINSSGVLDMLGQADTIPALTMTGGSVLGSGTLGLGGNATINGSTTGSTISVASLSLGGTARTFTVADGAAATDLDITAAVTSAGGGIVKTGAGTMRLGGAAANTYTGLTSVTAGTLLLSKGGSIGGDLAIGDLAGGVNADVVRLENMVNHIPDGAQVTVDGAGLFDVANTQETIGSLSLIGGNVAIGAGGVLTVASAITATGDNDAISGAGSLDLNGIAAHVIHVGPDAFTQLDISAAIVNGGVVKTGKGTLRLSGAAANAYDGLTTVNEGTLLLAKTGGAEMVGSLVVGDDVGAPGSTVLRYGAGTQISASAGLSVVVRSDGLLDLNGFSDTIRDLVLAGGSVSTGAGTLTVSGNISYQANFATSGVSGNLDMGGGVKALVVGDGEQFVDLEVFASVTGGGLNVNGPGVVRLSGNNSFTGGLALNSGTLLIGSNAAAGTTPLVANGGTLGASNGSRSLPAGLVVAGDVTVDTAPGLTFASLRVDGHLTKNGTGVLIAVAPSMLGGLTTLNGGALAGAFTLNGSFVHNGGTLSSTFTNNGTYTYNGGTFQGQFFNQGTFQVNADMAVSAEFENRSALTVGPGRTVTTNFGLRNLGTLNLEGGTIAGTATVLNQPGGQVLARGTVSAPLTNLGFIDATGSLALTSGNVANYGTVAIGAGESITQSNMSNSGLIQLAGGGVNGQGLLSNVPGGQVVGSGGVGAAMDNAGGLVHATGSTLVLSNLIGNTAGGELRVADGASMVVINGFPSSGTIVLSGPQANLAAGPVTNTGTLSGRGRFSAPLLNGGVVRAEGGLLTINGAGSTNVAAGTIQAPVGATVFYSQGLATSAGTIALSGGTFDTNNTPITNSGTIDGRGTFRSGGLTNAGRISIADGPTDFFGVVTNSGTFDVVDTTVTFFSNVTNGVAGVIKTTNSTSRFLGTFTNNGAFISDPSDNFFDDLAVGEAGYLVGGAGDRFLLTGDLRSASARRGAWNTEGAELHFLPGAAGRRLLDVNGEDRGASYDGYAGNFAWGVLRVGAGQSLELQDADGAAGGAVYVRALRLDGGLGQVGSIVGNGMNLYYDIVEPANAYLGGQTYALAGGGTLAAVPEPGAAVMVAMIGMLLSRRRRRD